MTAPVYETLLDRSPMPISGTAAVLDLLKELHTTGATICMVTHDARYASHAERTIHLFDGRVVEESVATASH